MVAGRVSLAVALFGPAAVAAAAGLSAQAAWEAPTDFRTSIGAAAAAACLVLAVGIAAGLERLVVWALVAICGVLAAATGLGHEGFGLAPLDAAALVLAWDAGHAAVELREPALTSRRFAVRRAGWSTALVGGALLVGWLALLPGRTNALSGAAPTLIGVLATLAALLLAVQLARRHGRHRVS
jgi:hypothetical protein